MFPARSLAPDDTSLLGSGSWFVEARNGRHLIAAIGYVRYLTAIVSFNLVIVMYIQLRLCGYTCDQSIGVAKASFNPLSSFLTHNLGPLMPAHTLYPSTGTTCLICHDPFHTSHTPILVTNFRDCRRHIFGYVCLRKCISSVALNADKCPLCRTVWLCVMGSNLRRVNRK